MNENRDVALTETDEELIGVLTAISVVSKRLARKLLQQSQTSKSDKGGNESEQCKFSGKGCRRTAEHRVFY